MPKAVTWGARMLSAEWSASSPFFFGRVLPAGLEPTTASPRLWTWPAFAMDLAVQAPPIFALHAFVQTRWSSISLHHASPAALGDLATALLDELATAHQLGHRDAINRWLRLLWPCLVALGDQLDGCLRDLQFNRPFCFLRVYVASPRVRARARAHSLRALPHVADAARGCVCAH